jgi:tripartite-type tricarboxylate transporter receptor subunit TctC
MFAPAKTDAAIIELLNREIVRVLRRPDIKQRFFDIGAEVVASSPEEYADAIRIDTAKWKKVIAAAGIRPE